jgi:hypothetical protein
MAVAPPRAVRAVLVERFGDDPDVQRVFLVLTARIIGTLARYEGASTDSVVPEGER